MNKSICKLTVLFQDPFWVGVFEDECGKKYNVARVVFGSEPTEVQLYEFILNNYYEIPFHETKSQVLTTQKKVNYKRLQKQVKKQQNEKGIGTKAQNAIKIQHELSKVERIKKRKEKREEERDRSYKLKQMKKKEKHKGH
ncbi:YjdF family protein (plasmid) [Paraclostridium ghonii]|uniref:YjdF family protein n=1 Tax=Paraclostridium ghonii TaxID=29358 RepID=UPI00202CDDB2|nr:YjdF family protein [Paeniclostridium ghonii]MCM0165102.1 YjdF family protein [Paeniclostridium ghonii]